MIKTQFHSWKPAIYHVKSTHSVINVSILCLNYKLLPNRFSDGEMISSVISGKVRAFSHQFCFPLAIHNRNIVHLISHYSDQTTLLSTMLLDLKLIQVTIFLRVFFPKSFGHSLIRYLRFFCAVRMIFIIISYICYLTVYLFSDLLI